MSVKRAILASVRVVRACVCVQLQMLGYDVSWAAFNVIEVMSSPKFTHKVWAFRRLCDWWVLNIGQLNQSFFPVWFSDWLLAIVMI